MSVDTADEGLNDGETDEQDLTAFDESSPAASEQESIRSVISGEAFDIDALNKFLLEKEGRIIAVVGDFRSGKTTLAAALYGFLKEGPFDSLEFVESRTLLGLERRVHTSTIDSGNSTPDTERTSIQAGVQFLHLELINQHSRKRRDLFFSDRAGEFYSHLRSGEISSDKLDEITKADVLLILLDGERLCDTRKRANACESVRQTIRVLIEENGIKPGTLVQIITTKMDLILNAPNAEHIATQLSCFEASLFSQMEKNLPNLSFAHITVRGQQESSPELYPFSQIVSDWLTYERPLQPRTKPSLTLSNEFDRLIERTI